MRRTSFYSIQYMLRDGFTIVEIASKLNLTVSTVIGYVALLISKGEYFDLEKHIDKSKIKPIVDSFNELGFERLKPVKERLGDSFSYDEIDLVRVVYFKKSLYNVKFLNNQKIK